MRMRRLIPAAVVATLALGPGAASSLAGVANAGIPGALKSNPLAGMRWGAWKPDTDNPGVDKPTVYWRHAHSAADKAAFAKIVDQPRFRWVGWQPVHSHGSAPGARETARTTIEDVTHGNPNIGTQFAVFGIHPWETQVTHQVPSPGQVSAYKAWVREFAKGIGRSRVALELQPDVPFALRLPHHSPVAFHELTYAARVFNKLPHTSVYIDAGAADYIGSAHQAARMLKRAGVAHAQGFALNATHYGSTHNEVVHGKAVIRALARMGLKGKHYIVNTAGNGHPFTGYLHRKAIRSHAICHSRHQKFCISMGAAPTTTTHAKGDDGNLWFGRPWVDGSPSTYDGVLRLVRTSPFG